MHTYPIGTPGTPWGPSERAAWRALQQHHRSYDEEVVQQIRRLGDRFHIDHYATLPYEDAPHPLFGLRSRRWEAGRPTVLVTGGVHGYETSGVHGALRFARECTPYEDRFNLVIAPCVSPWGYETINRWNPDAVDPNRAFVPGSPSPECTAVMAWVRGLPASIDVHFDLHETTDTDNSEFRPARAARDGITQRVWNIPDGFYLVGRTDRPVPDFQAAARDAVAEVTHIAEADETGCLIGVPLQQHGVIEYDAVGLGLCMGMTDAPFTTTTEVYPDSPRATAEVCSAAQVAAVRGGLDFLTRTA